MKGDMDRMLFTRANIAKNSKVLFDNKSRGEPQLLLCFKNPEKLILLRYFSGGITRTCPG